MMVVLCYLVCCCELGVWEVDMVRCDGVGESGDGG